MRGIRSGSGGRRIVILNHPRDVKNSGFRPFGAEQFNPVSGEMLRGRTVSFDAVELVNSGAMRVRSYARRSRLDGALEPGASAHGGGASDSHDVSRYIVGQARTYIDCLDRIRETSMSTSACRSLRQGQATVSLGLLARITVDGRSHSGDLAVATGHSSQVGVTVVGPSWIQADRVELYADGLKIREQADSLDGRSRHQGPGELGTAASGPRPRAGGGRVGAGSHRTLLGASPSRTSPARSSGIRACSA